MSQLTDTIGSYLQKLGTGAANVEKFGYGMDKNQLDNLGHNAGVLGQVAGNVGSWFMPHQLVSPQDNPQTSNISQSYNIDQYGSPITHQQPSGEDMATIAGNQAKQDMDLPYHAPTPPNPPTQPNILQQAETAIKNVFAPQAAESQLITNNYPKTSWYHGFQPKTPPPAIASAIKSAFGKDAPLATFIAATENANYDPRVPDNINKDGSKDRGVFQINEPTFNGLMQRRGGEMQKLGINSFDDMYDPVKNAQVAKMVFDEGGPGRWYGWQHKGYDLLNGQFTSPYITAGK